MITNINRFTFCCYWNDLISSWPIFFPIPCDESNRLFTDGLIDATWREHYSVHHSRSHLVRFPSLKSTWKRIIVRNAVGYARSPEWNIHEKSANEFEKCRQISPYNTISATMPALKSFHSSAVDHFSVFRWLTLINVLICCVTLATTEVSLIKTIKTA
jgi:hypothetical protein